MADANIGGYGTFKLMHSGRSKGLKRDLLPFHGF